MEDKPKVVCLIGSSKWPAAHMQVMMEETLKGHIVIPMGLYGHADIPPGARAATNGSDDNNPVKQMLDRLHFAKIDLAQEVVAVVVDGYLGSSTRREIEYCRDSGKNVRIVDIASSRLPQAVDEAALQKLLELEQRTVDQEARIDTMTLQVKDLDFLLFNRTIKAGTLELINSTLKEIIRKKDAALQFITRNGHGDECEEEAGRALKIKLEGHPITRGINYEDVIKEHLKHPVKTHEVKSHPRPFQEVKSGRKLHEIRMNDRDYHTGDVLVQKEWDPVSAKYSGEEVAHVIGHCTYGPAWGIPERMVVMTLLSVPSALKLWTENGYSRLIQS